MVDKKFHLSSHSEASGTKLRWVFIAQYINTAVLLEVLDPTFLQWNFYSTQWYDTVGKKLTNTMFTQCLLVPITNILMYLKMKMF